MANPTITQLVQIIDALESRITNLEGKLMAASTDILALLDQVNTSLTAIAAKQNGSISPAEAQAIKDKLAAIVASAQQLAQ